MKIISLIGSLNSSLRHKSALVASGEVLSHDAVIGGVAAMIEQLRARHVRPGQRVLLIADHDDNALFFLAAASAIGVQVLMPYNLVDTATNEWRTLIEAAHPDHVVYAKANAQALSDLGPVPVSVLIVRISAEQARLAAGSQLLIESPDPIDDFLVLFSSGTTGQPKAISISERLVCQRIVSVSNRLGFGPDSRIFMSGLMNNTTGVIFSFGSLLHGATLYYPPTRQIEDWPREIQRLSISHIMLRPVALQRFVDGVQRDQLKLGSLKVLAYGAAALPLPLLKRARQLLPCQWIQGYGLSETFGPFSWLTEEDHSNGLPEQLVYCVGRPDDTLEVALLKAGQLVTTPHTVGEVVLRGDGLMQGYLDPTLTQVRCVEGWFHTGDHGQWGPQGELVLKGRISQSILTPNGHRIYPQEVEGVLSAVPGVQEALLLSLPNQGNDLGNTPVACVYGRQLVRRQAAAQEAVRLQLKRLLSAEKWPEYLYISPSPFPKSANDKILRNQVAASLNAVDLLPINPVELCHETV